MCVRVCVHVYTYKYTHLCIFVYLYIYIQTFIHTYTYVYICMCDFAICMYVWNYVCMLFITICKLFGDNFRHEIKIKRDVRKQGLTHRLLMTETLLTEWRRSPSLPLGGYFSLLTWLKWLFWLPRGTCPYFPHLHADIFTLCYKSLQIKIFISLFRKNLSHLCNMYRWLQTSRGCLKIEVCLLINTVIIFAFGQQLNSKALTVET